MGTNSTTAHHYLSLSLSTGVGGDKIYDRVDILPSLQSGLTVCLFQTKPKVPPTREMCFPSSGLPPVISLMGSLLRTFPFTPPYNSLSSTQT